MKKTMLDKDELALEQELAGGEWVDVPDMADALQDARGRARQALQKSRKINIRLTDWDYQNIKLKATREGLPYQTLVSSIIHKYLTGQLTSR